MKKLRIGITGGIGSGKSSASNIIEEAGYPVLKADDIAKEFLFGDENIKADLVNEFGKSILKNGKIDKKFLTEKVFSSKENIKAINKIIHPPTIQHIVKLMKQALQNYDMVFVEAALIFEANMENLFDKIIVVSADKKLRIRRVMQRDSRSVEEIEKIIDKQMSDELRNMRADYIIKNNYSFKELTTETNNVLERLLQQISK